MDIQVNNLIPFPIKNSLSPSGEIWGKNLTFKSNQIIHIHAPSGSGKSTLVGILYGTRLDFEGDLAYQNSEDQPLSNYSWDDLRRNHIAVVFQELLLLPELTAMENILIKNQLTNKFSIAEIEAFASGLGILHLLDKKAGELSRGEKQRVAILRSVCMPFRWILLDEPFSALDEENASKAAALISHVVQLNNAGIIMANLYEDNHFEYAVKLKMV